MSDKVKIGPCDHCVMLLFASLLEAMFSEMYLLKEIQWSVCFNIRSFFHSLFLFAHFFYCRSIANFELHSISFPAIPSHRNVAMRHYSILFRTKCRRKKLEFRQNLFSRTTESEYFGIV